MTTVVRKAKGLREGMAIKRPTACRVMDMPTVTPSFSDSMLEVETPALASHPQRALDDPRHPRPRGAAARVTAPPRRTAAQRPCRNNRRLERPSLILHVRHLGESHARQFVAWRSVSARAMERARCSADATTQPQTEADRTTGLCERACASIGGRLLDAEVAHASFGGWLRLLHVSRARVALATGRLAAPNVSERGVARLSRARRRWRC